MPTPAPLVLDEVSAAIACYDQEATSILQEFIKKVEAKKPPSLLYHYTNDVAVTGIIEGGKIWFSDIFRQNDPSELRHGLSIAIDALKSLITDDRPEIGTFTSLFERLDLDGGIEASAHYFISCFSGNGDDLGQWRAYAENGLGFALGFDTSSLEEAFTKKGGKLIEHHSTFPITYDDMELTRIQSELAKIVRPLISLPRTTDIRGRAMHAYMKELLVSHSVGVLRLLMFFKHEAYKNEDEYRFLQIYEGDRPAPDVKYRKRPSVITRYREFDWRSQAPKALKKIVIGPAANRAQATRFVKDCLAAFHADPDNVELVHSKIPYRV